MNGGTIIALLISTARASRAASFSVNGFIFQFATIIFFIFYITLTIKKNTSPKMVITADTIQNLIVTWLSGHPFP